ncbi:hypothetical protein [Schleiferilactobacillus harbinensis]|uniref:Uncharacterized protein n=1 Tax=Schleiferilactobacillus harbinensis TaxID=304207 RepID=A0A5P8M6G9_9LACO|nr:hypothetical protein [Schleiferilactobacillus harbinensis]QFR24106.1 hypothetical protein D1010_12320 [Schleiferilactobacillus harbinensis]
MTLEHMRVTDTDVVVNRHLIDIVRADARRWNTNYSKFSKATDSEAAALKQDATSSRRWRSEANADTPSGQHGRDSHRRRTASEMLWAIVQAHGSRAGQWMPVTRMGKGDGIND